MRRHSWFPSACVSLGLLLVAASASAQTITPGDPLRPRRDKEGNPNRLLNNQVNREECFVDDIIRYPLTLSGVGSSDLEVWAGSGCEALENRTSTNNTCWLVYEESSPDADAIDIRAQDIIAGKVDPGSYTGTGSGTDEACNETKDSSPRTASLFFLLLDSSDEVVGKPTTNPEVEFDLLGPEPPEEIEVGVGEESLVVKFEIDDDSSDDIDRYEVFCDVAGQGAGGAGSDASGCSSSVLVPAEPPPAQYSCGETTRTSEEAQTDDDLENGTNYVVGIAAVDAFGNPGALSAVACATPEPINGFFEEYRAAGGKGGGGFCSFAQSRAGRDLWLGSALLAGSLFLRRRAKGGRA